jgi:hypothetical protein
MPDFGMMTSAHVLYIPFVFLVGAIGGWTLGVRAAQREFERQKRRMKE